MTQENSTNNTSNSESVFIKDSKKRDSKKKTLSNVFELAKRPGSNGEGSAAWAKIELILPQVTRCTTIGHSVQGSIACKSCSGIVRQICQYKEDLNKKEEKEKKESKGSRKNENISFAVFVHLFKNKSKRKDILKAMVNSGMTDSAAKTLYGKLSCVCNAILNPTKKSSCVYQVINNLLFQGPSIDSSCDKSSVAFVTRVCNAWVKE